MSSSNDLDESVAIKRISKLPGVAFIIGAAGISVLAGFAVTLFTARKIEPSAFAKGFQAVASGPPGKQVHHESGVRFAFRALGWGTVLAVGGVGSLAYLAWRVIGASNMPDLNNRLQSSFPSSWRLKPTDPSTNFQSFHEFLAHVTSDDRAQKSKKND